MLPKLLKNCIVTKPGQNITVAETRPSQRKRKLLAAIFPSVKYDI